ncbi:Protein of unknown function [Gryllus bimaculatus]|nr:Protein of unknown function [Gryllus bimaculatus]
MVCCNVSINRSLHGASDLYKASTPKKPLEDSGYFVITASVNCMTHFPQVTYQLLPYIIRRFESGSSSSESQRTKTILSSTDGGCINDELLRREKLRVETFLLKMDTLVSSLQLQSKAHVKMLRGSRFWKMCIRSSSRISKYCNNLAIFYSGDLITADIMHECHHFAGYLKCKEI